MATKICKPQDLQNVVEVGASSTNVISLIGNSLGTTTESRTDLVNSTAATVGAQQYSPSLYMRGSGWKTNATAAAQYCDIQQFVAPFQSTASPLSAWTLQSRVNEGSWTTIMTASQLSINFSLTSYFTENTVFPSNRSVFFNSATDCGFKFSTPQTVDSLLFFLDSTSRTCIITDNANVAKDHYHTAQANPTLFIHSVKDPDTANDEWISFTHDGTDGAINTGSGDINFGTPIETTTYRSSVTNGSAFTVSSNVLRISQSEDEMRLGIDSSTGRMLILTDSTNITNDHAHAVQTDPTLFIHSVKDPDTANDEWISFTHDGTNGYIDLGSGVLNINGEFQALGEVAGSGLANSRISSASNGGTGWSLANTSTGGKSYTILSTGASSAGGAGDFSIFNVTDVKYLFRIKDTGVMILGDGDAATTALTGNTFRAPDITTGGAGNIAGADLTIQSGLGTGTGDPGTIIFNTTIAAAAGDNIHTQSANTMVLDSGKVGIGTDSPDTQLHTTGGRSRNVTTVAAGTYDLLVTDDILHVTYTGSAAVTSLTLPTAQTTAGRTIIIKDAGGNASTNNITIDTEAAQTIDGAATRVINGDYDSLTIYCDGSNWFII